MSKVRKDGKFSLMLRHLVFARQHGELTTRRIDLIIPKVIGECVLLPAVMEVVMGVEH